MQEALAGEINTGRLLAMIERHDAAIAAYRRAITTLDKLAGQQAAVLSYQTELAGALRLAGVSLAEAGQRDEALAALERARAIRSVIAGATLSGP
jgi:tetratricopeptide (TPR) repeat protein